MSYFIVRYELFSVCNVDIRAVQVVSVLKIPEIKKLIKKKGLFQLTV